MKLITLRESTKCLILMTDISNVCFCYTETGFYSVLKHSYIMIIIHTLWPSDFSFQFQLLDDVSLQSMHCRH